MMTRPVGVPDLPTSGPDPWFAEIHLRETGPAGIILPTGRDELLMVVEVKPEAIEAAGGPHHLRTLVEPQRKQLARGAWLKGYREGWAVETDIVRGRRRRLWVVGEDVRA